MPTVHIIEAHHLKAMQFLVIDNIAFYRSSGDNSGETLKGTWLPCLGFPGKLNPYGVLKDFMVKKDHQIMKDGKCLEGRCEVNWLVKVSFLWRDKKIASDIATIIDESLKSLYPTLSDPTDHDEFNIDNFIERMGYIKAAIISAKLGGGVWDSEFGVALKEKLAKAYPDVMLQTPYEFGQKFLVFESAPSAFSTVNRALKSRGAVFKQGIMKIPSKLYTSPAGPTFYKSSKEFDDDVSKKALPVAKKKS